MRPWDIYLFAFEEEGAHPAVVISNEERCQNTDLVYVNALLCTSAKLNRELKKNEIILDESDGLDWKTAVRCDVIYLLEKSGFREMRGSVAPLRRKLVARKIVECLRLPL
ncbi:MAG: type II toxin-antitoxin system PemK/MazF family toxin [Methylacidiphilales bacterium]|nr:type II toxin-antitoxin system PemK/MazF family toxin [Candidatus Methylacidiphilales bacterium]